MLLAISEQMEQLLEEFATIADLKTNSLLVVGCSTSEVLGKRIGTAGALDVAKAIYDPLKQFAEKHGVALAFQCCEHLNRALVIDREAAETRGYEEVTVIPVPNAGGSMAAYAYEQLKHPVVVEEIKADAGIDIGDTLIGMHLKKVAVPVRTSIRSIGEAHVTLAKTRPKLIGGERACYRKK